MKIENIVVGNLSTNCYLIKKNKDLLIIDPGAEFEKIDSYINNYNLIGVIITHHHFDHVGALKELVNKYKVNVYDFNNLNEGLNTIGDFVFDIIYTPGHTDDSITIYFKDDKLMFTGDFIFKNSIGRTDLGGNDLDMFSSISKIKKYPDVVIYPGHGEFTTLKYEKDNNVYFK